jgi:phosphate starvation-inducible PhoH-like protein
MFLTRIGFGSKVIITGDLTQKDLPIGSQSGLDVAIKVLSKIEDIGFAYLTAQDVVRHPLVQKIVIAYDAYETKVNKTDRTDNKDGEHKFQRKFVKGSKSGTYKSNSDKSFNQKKS